MATGRSPPCSASEVDLTRGDAAAQFLFSDGAPARTRWANAGVAQELLPLFEFSGR